MNKKAATLPQEQSAANQH